MLLRQIKRTFARFSKQKPLNLAPFAASSTSTPVRQKPPNSEQQYLVFPTKVPIFPFSFYAVRIRKQFYEYIKKSNINYAMACVMQPGVAKKKLFPLTESQMIEQLGLKKIDEPKEQKQENQPAAYENSVNNVIFDESFRAKKQTPVLYVDHISQIFPIASLCKIFLYTNKQTNEYTAHLRAETRFEIDIDKFKQDKSAPLMYVTGKNIKNENPRIGINDIPNSAQYKSLMQHYKQIFTITQINMPFEKELPPLKTIELLGGYLCTFSYFNTLQLYNLFKTLNAAERVKIMVEYYKQYANVLEVRWKDLENKFKQKQEDNINKQKEYIQGVYEHLQGMLGLKADVQYIKKVKAKLATGRYPENVAKIIECQLQNIQDLGQGNPELNKKKQYLNLLLNYPFGQTAKQTYDIQKAKQILDQDHYGMKKIKQRILEFIAVSKIKGQFKSKVLLLHGPPGVGKTSIVKSIAKCLNRPYGRISLGGQYDTSIMKGHRKTYIGAYPGKIFDTIYKSKVENPVILLDEIDKVQARVGGASLQDVIMNVLDPIQNHKFKDEYLDIEIDLSKVLFICTANQLETIFPPLLDRMERIEVSGYTTGEKKQIFNRYVLKRSMQNAGIPEQLMTRINFSDEALEALIQGYCKEAGIRNLVRKTNQIFNKTALKFVKNEQFDKTITPKTLTDYIGLPKFKGVRLFEKIPPKGVIVGLAYNSFGGSIMYIQAAAAYVKQSNKAEPTTTITTPSTSQPKQLPKGSLIVTGNLHDVMKQSCQLAYSYAKYITSAFFNNNFLEVNDIHLNFPQIEIGKDGPSAGVAITCALISLALNKPSIRQIAMTGQINLSGRVCAIGGVKQKTMGAKRQGITHLIFPEENRRDIEQLQPEIKEGVTFYFASYFDQVMELVFGLKITVDDRGKEARKEVAKEEAKAAAQ